MKPSGSKKPNGPVTPGRSDACICILGAGERIIGANDMDEVEAIEIMTAKSMEHDTSQ